MQTPRLILKIPQIEDTGPLNLAIKNSLQELQRWQDWANDSSLNATKKFINKAIHQWNNDKQTDFPLLVLHKPNNKIIGASGYNDRSKPAVPYYEIGYWLQTAYTGQGLATELTNALTAYAFSKLKAVRVQIVIQAQNIKSINVAKRCGYVHEATLEKVRLDLFENKPADDYIFARFDLEGLQELELSY